MGARVSSTKSYLTVEKFILTVKIQIVKIQIRELLDPRKV